MKKYAKDLFEFMLSNADTLNKLILLYSGVPLQILEILVRGEEKEEKKTNFDFR